MAKLIVVLEVGEFIPTKIDPVKALQILLPFPSWRFGWDVEVVSAEWEVEGREEVVSVDQTPDEPTGLLCKGCRHDLSDHKTSKFFLGYPCVFVGCQCGFFTG